MSHDFDFGLEDLLEEGSNGRTVGGWVALGLGLIFFLLSAMTTAAFFYRFAPGLGFLFGAAAGAYVAAAVGVITLDVAALAWSYVRARGCTSRGQQALAGIVGAADLAGALLVSGLYVLLAGSALDAGVTDTGGALTDFGRGLHLLGTVIVTAALVVNFGAIWVFSALSANTRAAAHATELAAVIREGQHKIDSLRARQVIGRTLKDIQLAMPAAAAEAAEDNRRRYLSNKMSNSSAPKSAAPPVEDSVVSSNGHGGPGFFAQGGQE